MNHARCEGLLAVYRDLGCDERQAVEAHVAACPECAATLRANQAMDRELSALPDLSPSPRLRERYQAAAIAQPRCAFWRALGDVAGWAAVAAVAVALLASLAVSARPLAERAWPGHAPDGQDGSGQLAIVRDEPVAVPYNWPPQGEEGERIDRVPQLSPDGTRVAYLPRDSKAGVIDLLVVRDLATGTDRNLTPEEGALYTSVRWSPDGRTLAFVKTPAEGELAGPSEVWRVEADGHNAQLLYRAPAAGGGPDPSLALAGWSADGRYVELQPLPWDPSGASGTRARLRADGSGLETEPEPASEWFQASQDALVGHTLYASVGGYALRIVRSAGLRERPDTAPAGGQALMLYDLETGRATILGAFAGEIYNPSPSPDGRWIAFDAVSGPGPACTYLVRRDGSGLRRVSGEDMVGGGPFWAGSRHLLFHQAPEPKNGMQGALYAVDVESGQLQRLWQGPANQAVVSASSDGRRLLAIRGWGDKAELRWLELDVAPMPAVARPTPTRSTTPGPTVVEILANPPAPGESFKVDAYYSGASVAPLGGGPRPASDEVVCPSSWASALTDRPFQATLSVLNGRQSNSLPAGDAWLVAVTPEMAQRGVRAAADLPYHARLRGHLGDAAFAHCPDAARIFMVEEVVQVYRQEPPAAPPYGFPEGYAAWPRYHDASWGYNVPHPPDWRVEQQDLATVLLHAPDWPGHPITIRVHEGETRYDQYDPASTPPLLQGNAWSVFQQGLSFGAPAAGSRPLAGYRVDREDSPGERTVSVLLSAHGRTYELSLRYPTGFASPQPLLTAYTAVVEGFELDVAPGPTPAPPVRQGLGEGPFLTQEQALARLIEAEGQALALLSARLVPEAAARLWAGPCATFTGHPEGVWLLTARGPMEGRERTVRFFLDATTGAKLCGEEVAPSVEGEFSIRFGSEPGGEVALSADDLVAYDPATHEMVLTPEAAARLAALMPPTTGLPFAVCVGNEVIYHGAFWPGLSSQSYDGVVIDPILAGQGTVSIDLGYPGPPFFKGEDPRADPRILQALERAGKLKGAQ